MKTKVLFVGINFAPEVTGIAPYTTQMASYLSERGYDVSALAGYPHYPEWTKRPGYRRWRHREAVDGVPVTRLDHIVPAQTTARGRILMELTFAARVFFTRWDNPDVVIAVTPTLLSAAAVVARRSMSRHRPKVVMWVQDFYGRGALETGALNGRNARLTARLESSVLQRADAVVAIHDRFKRVLIDDIGLEPADIRVIRNWSHVDLAPGDATGDPRAAGLRSRLGLGTGDVLVLHAGNMGAKQGLENVVDAAFLAAGTRVHFVMVGDGNQRSTLEERGQGCTNVHFVDPLPSPEFERALCDADILLVNERPTVSEMCVPSKLTTYLATGQPIVAATPQGSVTHEEIRSTGAGVRAPAGDPRALLDTVLALADSPEQRRLLGQRGKIFHETVLDATTAVANFDSLIASTLASTPSTPSFSPKLVTSAENK